MINNASIYVLNPPLECDICIVGAGAAGITLALELDNSGLNVLLLEAGDIELKPENQDLFQGNLTGPYYHAPLTESRHRQLGGTTTVWGGRCLPLDGIDFEKRPYADGSGWPITKSEIGRYYHRAQHYCQVGDFKYLAEDALPGSQPELIAGLRDSDLVSTTIERWGPPADFGRDYRDKLTLSHNVHVVLGANCVGFGLDNITGEKVRSVHAACLDGGQFQVHARFVVLAAGGLEVTRLMLASLPQQATRRLKWLGRGYMGHIGGSVATVRFNGDPNTTECEYELNPESVYCRRRFWISDEAQRRLGILNFAATLENPSKHDATHRNGVLSAAYLALRTPILRHRIAPGYQLALALGDRAELTAQANTKSSQSAWSHLRNIVMDIGPTAKFLPVFAYKRFIQKPRIPGFIVRSSINTYDLKYSAEQTPYWQSRVTLGATRDKLGLPQLEVDYRIRDTDLESIHIAHKLIGQELRAQGIGELTFKAGDALLEIERQIGDGVHQIGTTRMSNAPSNGVVDRNCRVHGIQNLFIASSAVFPTSGHANPTLTIVALAARLADHLKAQTTSTRTPS